MPCKHFSWEDGGASFESPGCWRWYTSDDSFCVSAQQKEWFCLLLFCRALMECVWGWGLEGAGTGFPKAVSERVSICFLKLNHLLGDFLIQFWLCLGHGIPQKFLLFDNVFCYSELNPQYQPCSGCQDRRDLECCRKVPSLIKKTKNGHGFTKWFSGRGWV